ncbi:MAG: hypothetical protein NTX09_12145, partial [Verrucomicrobia bacterium]|nr:hypothetical protein [Verrucomicrobiota bacterium]
MKSCRHTILLLSFLTHVAMAQTNLNDVPADLTVPPTEAVAPAAGKRVRATTPGWAATAVHHTLYLPEE